jgi:hypothetical protein
MVSVPVKTKAVTRDKLAQFLQNHELIKLFENLAQDVSTTLPTATLTTAAIAQQALSMVASALALISERDDDPGMIPGPTGPQGQTGAPGPVGPMWITDTEADDLPMVPPSLPGQRFLRAPSSAATSDQSISAATLTLIAGTSLSPQGFFVGQTFRWTIYGSSGALGSSANTISVRIGTGNSTSDAAVATFTTPAGTASTSTFKIEILLTIRSLGAAATAVAYCLISNSASTGFIGAQQAVLTGTMVTFDSTVAGQFAHVDLQTGANKTATISLAFGEVAAPDNPTAINFS